MPPTPALVCNFTLSGTNLSENQSLGVSFQTDDGGKTYGGTITLFSPASVGPITTSLWDSDGNVFFTVYLVSESSNPVSPSCTINSGSIPGSFTPQINVVDQNGLTCVISQTESEPSKGVYNYILEITISASS